MTSRLLPPSCPPPGSCAVVLAAPVTVEKPNAARGTTAAVTTSAAIVKRAKTPLVRPALDDFLPRSIGPPPRLNSDLDQRTAAIVLAAAKESVKRLAAPIAKASLGTVPLVRLTTIRNREPVRHGGLPGLATP